MQVNKLNSKECSKYKCWQDSMIAGEFLWTPTITAVEEICEILQGPPVYPALPLTYTAREKSLFHLWKWVGFHQNSYSTNLKCLST